MVTSGIGDLGVMSRGVVALRRARPPRRLGVISSGGGRIARAAAAVVVGVVPVTQMTGGDKQRRWVRSGLGTKAGGASSGLGVSYRSPL